MRLATTINNKWLLIIFLCFVAFISIFLQTFNYNCEEQPLNFNATYNHVKYNKINSKELSYPTSDTDICKFIGPIPRRKDDNRIIFTDESLTWVKMMNKSTSFKAKSAEYDYTVVVGAWRRPGYLKRIIASYENQTHQPKEIWVSIYASPTEEEYRQVFPEIEKMQKELEDKHPNSTSKVKYVIGKPQLSYWGRFQMAMAVKTPYVVIADDDSLPGFEFIEGVFHMIHSKGFTGIYGVKGIGNHNNIMSFRPAFLKQMDLIGGSWIMKTSWLKYLFREEPFTWITGEDFQFSYTVRKYANVPTWVPPTTASNSTWGASDDYFEISEKGDTTYYIKDGRVEIRPFIRDRHWRRGFPWAKPPEDLVKEIVLLVADNVEDAKITKGLFQKIIERGNVFIAIAVPGNKTSSELDIMLTYSSKVKMAKDRLWFNLMIGEGYLDRDVRTTDIEAEAIIASRMIFEAANIKAVIGRIKESPFLRGIVTSAQGLGIPYLGYLYSLEDVINPIGKSLSRDALKICTNFDCIIQTAESISLNKCDWV